jgi:predicted ATPase/class 3 adenylate cyclase
MTGGEAITRTPTGTVTFLFTDIEGSTPLWDSHPDAMGAALARHDAILRSAIADADGHIFSTGGDGYAAVFARAASAVEAALAAQRALSTEEWTGGPVLRVRMGIHTGEAEERDGDYFGPPVNRAARIMSAANGGQIVVSDLTAGIIDGISEFKLFDLGPVQLKGVVEPVHVVGVAGEGHEWVDTPLLTTEISRGNLPRPQTERVGDLADLQRRVANLAQARVVTLTGSGGVGKTRTAVEIGWLVVDEFIDGVWLVELAPIADPDLTFTGIATSLGVLPQPGMSVIESIVDWCYGRRMLLILDNCEHVLDPVTDLVRAIVAGCPTVTIVATSREPLGVDGEIVVRIPSLEDNYGVELFVLRATSADSSFHPTDADHESIAAICRRLDGIPLAIELAAARIRSLSPSDLLARLDDRFRLLRGGGRGGLERHQTLRATVAWSYQLLTQESQVLFDRLSVFAGSFDLAAAEAICAGDSIDEYDVIDLLGDLVDKSMVIAVRSDSGTRYRLLETLRQYGEERLDDRGETGALRDAHLAHFASLSEELDGQWSGAEQASAIVRFDDDWENFSAAHNWAITTSDLDAASMLVAHTAGFGIARVRRDHQEWARRSLALAESRGERHSRILAPTAFWSFTDGDLATAIELAGTNFDDDDPQSIAFASMVSVTSLTAAARDADAMALVPTMRSRLSSADGTTRFALCFGIAQAMQGRPEAGPDIEALVEAALATGGPNELSHAIRMRAAHRFFMEREPDGAIVEAREAVRLNESVGTTPVWSELNLAMIMVLGGHPEARRELRRIIQSTYDERQWTAFISLLELPPVVLASEDPAAAATIFGHVQQEKAPWGEIGRQVRESTARLVEVMSDSAGLRACGAAMDRHEIAAFAINALAED